MAPRLRRDIRTPASPAGKRQHGKDLLGGRKRSLFYRKLAEGGDVRLAFCWSHVRRKFYELVTPEPAPIASGALEHIAVLYAVEKDIRGRGADERRAVRQQNSRPFLDALEPWPQAKLALISRKSKLADAIRYALSRWEGLTRFIDDGRIELDNNTVERSIRLIALNRKNALFAGSDGGAEHWATIASLIEICKLNDVEPFGPIQPIAGVDLPLPPVEVDLDPVAVELDFMKPLLPLGSFGLQGGQLGLDELCPGGLHGGRLGAWDTLDHHFLNANSLNRATRPERCRSDYVPGAL